MQKNECMSVLLEFTIFPTDKGESVSEYVSRIIAYIDKNKYIYQLTAMGTIVETETLNEGLNLISICNDLLEKDCDRIYISAKFDIRKHQKDRIHKKVVTVQEKIKIV